MATPWSPDLPISQSHRTITCLRCFFVAQLTQISRSFWVDVLSCDDRCPLHHSDRPTSSSVRRSWQCMTSCSMRWKIPHVRHARQGNTFRRHLEASYGMPQVHHTFQNALYLRVTLVRAVRTTERTWSRLLLLDPDDSSETQQDRWRSLEKDQCHAKKDNIKWSRNRHDNREHMSLPTAAKTFSISTDRLGHTKSIFLSLTSFFLSCACSFLPQLLFSLHSNNPFPFGFSKPAPFFPDCLQFYPQFFNSAMLFYLVQRPSLRLCRTLPVMTCTPHTPFLLPLAVLFKKV